MDTNADMNRRHSAFGIMADTTVEQKKKESILILGLGLTYYMLHPCCVDM